MNELKRANKITSYWEGEGVAVGIFYKTHDKIAVVRSTDDAVVNAGFVMPQGTDEVPVTAAQKLEAFKTFLAMNATAFGISYDPVDRRNDAFKFPGKYVAETFAQYAKDLMVMTVEEVFKSVQTNVIDKMVKSEHLPAGSVVQYGFGDPVINVGESYANGNIKYGTAVFPIAFAINGKSTETSVSIDLVSGQLKKPRNIGSTVLTMTGIKSILVEAGVLPKIEKPAKVEESEEAAAQ